MVIVTHKNEYSELRPTYIKWSEATAHLGVIPVFVCDSSKRLMMGCGLSLFEGQTKRPPFGVQSTARGSKLVFHGV